MHRGPSGRYELTVTAGERVNAFVPAPLPPDPPLVLDGPLRSTLEAAAMSLGRLRRNVQPAPRPHPPDLRLHPKGGGALLPDRRNAVVTVGPTASRDRASSRSPLSQTGGPPASGSARGLWSDHRSDGRSEADRPRLAPDLSPEQLDAWVDGEQRERLSDDDYDNWRIFATAKGRVCGGKSIAPDPLANLPEIDE